MAPLKPVTRKPFHAKFKASVGCTVQHVLIAKPLILTLRHLTSSFALFTMTKAFRGHHLTRTPVTTLPVLAVHDAFGSNTSALPIRQIQQLGQ